DVDRANLGVAVAWLDERGGWLEETACVPLSHRAARLQVDLALGETLLPPGGSTSARVTVRDADGRPVPGAEVVVLGVDEAVLKVAGGRCPDLWNCFFPRAWFHSDEVSPPVLQDVLPDPEANLAMLGSCLGSDVCCYLTGPSTAGVALCRDLNPLAFFHSRLQTDGSGQVEFPAGFPHSVTRWRITALAVRGRTYGQTETRAVTRLPLVLRPWIPRFVHAGDHFELALGIQNNTDRDLALQVEVALSRLAFSDGVERQVTVAAGRRARVCFPCRAEQAGEAVGLARVLSGSLEDAVRLKLPVHSPSLAEKVTWSGRAEGPLELPIDLHEDGGAELWQGSSPLPAARPSFDFLRDYRMHCSEQIASRLLGWLSAGPEWDPDHWRERAAELVLALEERQNRDGSFAYFPGWRARLPFVSAHATHALVRAHRSGLRVTPSRLDSALRNLQRGWPSPYALSVLSLTARTRPLAALGMALAPGLSGEGAAWLMTLVPSWAQSSLRRRMLDRLDDLPSDDPFPSGRRVLAAAALALLEERPGRELDELLARLAVPEPWGNTLDHAFTLLALSQAAARWAGGGRARECRTALRDPVLRLDGPCFYRATLTTVRDARQPAVERGLGVARTYVPGAVFQIRLDLQVPVERRWVCLTDPLPGGLELLPSPQQPAVPGAVHRACRDDRAELCWHRLAAGHHRVTLLALPTTPGRFLAPGTRVEEMYRPQVHGRSAAQEVEIN
ncbi:MAG: alpha-2-macroglobulin family protein, partial [Candidatus Eremiobacterota bacterium]